MFGYAFKKLRELIKNKRLKVSCLGVVVVLLVAFCLVFVDSHKDDANKMAAVSVPSAHLSGNNSGSTASHSTPPSANINTSSSSATTANTPTTTVLKTTTNSNSTTTKEVTSYKLIPFSSQTQNDVNLKRGTTHIQQVGQNGTETVVFLVTYDQNGNEVSSKTISDVITEQPVDQIVEIGVSDFNLNTDTWDGGEFGEICYPADYNSEGDGCVGVPSDRHFGAINISGTFFVNCISSITGTCSSDATVNVQPVIAVSDDNTFSYLGNTYLTDPRAGAGGSQPLTQSICLQYGLACGSW